VRPAASVNSAIDATSLLTIFSYDFLLRISIRKIAWDGVQRHLCPRITTRRGRAHLHDARMAIEAMAAGHRDNLPLPYRSGLR
jgi:hypothetical protein